VGLWGERWWSEWLGKRGDDFGEKKISVALGMDGVGRTRKEKGRRRF
jgi:hypothetical protein